MAAEGTRLKELDSRLKELSREIGRLRDLPSEVRQLSESISATDRDLHKLLEALEIQRKEDECFHTLESIFDSLAKNSSDLNLGSSFGGSRIPFQDFNEAPLQYGQGRRSFSLVEGQLTWTTPS
ncbi:unnamed protein product [Cuscuta epithymum]|nr:unnamed protein product [Cuscuta epithymum]